jgi:hypothetical protein
MSSDRDDDQRHQDPQGRQDTTPFWPPAPGGGQPQQPEQPAWGQEQYGAGQYGASEYGPGRYGETQYGQPQHAQQPSGHGGYGQGPYGQPQYAPGGYGQPQYGQWSPSGYGFGQDAPPARPGSVVTSAVLGFVFGALGVLVSVLLVAGGALIDHLFDTLRESDPSLSGAIGPDELNSVRGFFVVLALLALAWTVLMIWGSALAVRGRSRVPLLVGSSITVACTGLFLVLGLATAASEPGQDGGASGVVLFLVVFGAALAMPVLLCLRPAAEFFAAHRQRRR